MFNAMILGSFSVSITFVAESLFVVRLVVVHTYNDHKGLVLIGNLRLLLFFRVALDRSDHSFFGQKRPFPQMGLYIFYDYFNRNATPNASGESVLRA